MYYVPMVPIPTYLLGSYFILSIFYFLTQVIYLQKKCQQSLSMIVLEESHEDEARGWRPELQATENAFVKLR